MKLMPRKRKARMDLAFIIVDGFRVEPVVRKGIAMRKDGFPCWKGFHVGMLEYTLF